ncbi:response regulator [Pseudochrobactrum sp. HB0163]|uniref:response regulator n=1 Tax=Pseudochrobactrum sp. HB0163 TaxID=3450708 RepID=UPI003F6E0AC7
MSLSTRIAPHLPYLRRFSRAVTGSQAAGDAYVAAILETLIDDISVWPDCSSDKIALYRLYSSIFDRTSIEIPDNASSAVWEKHAARNLALLTPRSRQAFLLVSVEGFNEREAAEILDEDQAGFAALLAEASEHISRHIATRIMIIEDEPLIAMDIEQMVEELGHEVTAIARTRKEAVSLYHQTKPAMILADIQLADGSSGIDAVNEILKQDNLPVIFITAFPERLLTGERPEPAFLVTKPFNPDMVKALISQALFFEEEATAQA